MDKKIATIFRNDFQILLRLSQCFQMLLKTFTKTLNFQSMSSGSKVQNFVSICNGVRSHNLLCRRERPLFQNSKVISLRIFLSQILINKCSLQCSIFLCSRRATDIFCLFQNHLEAFMLQNHPKSMSRIKQHKKAHF